MILKDMPALEAALNEQSWEWLAEVIPSLAEAIQIEVIERNATPEQVRHFVTKKTQRPALAARCYQAAAYIATLRN